MVSSILFHLLSSLFFGDFLGFDFGLLIVVLLDELGYFFFAQDTNARLFVLADQRGDLN